VRALSLLVGQTPGLREKDNVTDTPATNEPSAPSSPPPSKRPALLRATTPEVVGASMRVAGLSVVERSIKQLDSMGLSIIVASDGSCTLPKYLPPSVILRKVPRPDDLAALRSELGNAVEIGANEVRPSNRSLEGGMKVVDEASRKRAETAIFTELMRGDLGFVAHYLNKPVSFFITRHFLCHLPFTPNHVTIGSAVVGLVGAALIASGNYAFMIWGFFLAHVQSILDGCDGELARVRFQQSAIGEWLDTMVDDGLNILIFAALGIGLYRGGGSTMLLLCGLGASFMHVIYDAVALTEIRRQGEGGEIIKVRWRIAGKDNMKTRLTQKRGNPMILVYSLGRRDFFVLAFLVYALLGLAKFALVHALFIAGPLCIIAFVQIIWRLRGSPE
jgi:phosphatidylglycerophosphate synthase